MTLPSTVSPTLSPPLTAIAAGLADLAPSEVVVLHGAAFAASGNAVFQSSATSFRAPALAGDTTVSDGAWMRAAWLAAVAALVAAGQIRLRTTTTTRHLLNTVTVVHAERTEVVAAWPAGSLEARLLDVVAVVAQPPAGQVAEGAGGRIDARMAEYVRALHAGGGLEGVPDAHMLEAIAKRPVRPAAEGPAAKLALRMIDSMLDATMPPAGLKGVFMLLLAQTTSDPGALGRTIAMRGLVARGLLETRQRKVLLVFTKTETFVPPSTAVLANQTSLTPVQELLRTGGGLDAPTWTHVQSALGEAIGAMTQRSR